MYWAYDVCGSDLGSCMLFQSGQMAHGLPSAGVGCWRLRLRWRQIRLCPSHPSSSRKVTLQVYMVAMFPEQQESQALMCGHFSRFCFCHVCYHTHGQSKAQSQSEYEGERKIPPFDERGQLPGGIAEKKVLWPALQSTTACERHLGKLGEDFTLTGSLPRNTMHDTKSPFSLRPASSEHCFRRTEMSDEPPHMASPCLLLYQKWNHFDP